MNSAALKVSVSAEIARILAARYHSDDARVLRAAAEGSPEQFVRLFLTAHGMAPFGLWRTHTYARIKDSVTGRDHFFLIPLPAQRAAATARPFIRFNQGELWIDEFLTAVRPQGIPHTTPFWYFHYDPNLELDRPYDSMTLNLKPACPEKCTLCAGAKTGRVNNGMDGSLGARRVFETIFAQHPQAPAQLDSVAVVTGCFDSFDAMTAHLAEVREAALSFAQPRVFRVLEHNVATPAQFERVVGELGYDVFVTLECYDQSLRKLALNGNVGRKGRNRREFVEMIGNYAAYLDSRPELPEHRRIVHVTYLAGIDSLETMEELFRELAQINHRHPGARIVPWMSVFTAYADSMRVIQNRSFSLGFLFEAQALARRYFGAELMDRESGSTADGYARGLF